MKKILILFVFFSTILSAQVTPIPSPNKDIPYLGAIKSASLGAWNAYSNNFLSKTTQVTSSTGTTSLTLLSTRVQELIGALTHSFNLPSATSLLTGFTIEFNNNSNGNLFIQNFSGSTQKTVIPGGYCIAICTSTSTSAGIWDFHYLLPANSQYGTAGITITGNANATGTLGISGAAVLQSSTTIGTGTAAANTTSLGILRVKQGNGFVDIGQASSGFSNIWLGQGTPSATNYGIGGDANSTYLNAPSSVIFSTGNSQRAFLSSTIFSTSVAFLTTNTLSVGGDLFLTTNNKSLYGKGSDGINYSLLNFGTGDNITIQGRQGTSDIYLSPNASSVSIACKGNNGNVGIKNPSPVASLDVNGNLKIAATQNTLGATIISSAQSSTLTMGATSGTNAVLSDVVFPVNCMAYPSNPSDGTTYYFGNTPSNWGPLSVQGNGKVYIPYNATLIGWTANFCGTAGSAESATLSINIDNSPTVLNSAITITVAGTVNTYSASGLSTSINAGSYVEAKLACPTWVTNPASVGVGITFLFVRRQ